MGYPQILSFIDDDKIKYRFATFGNHRGQYAEEPRVRYGVRAGQHFPDALENGPEDGALLFRQPSLSSESANVPVRFPGFQLPRVYNILPFAQDESPAELMLTGLRR